MRIQRLRIGRYGHFKDVELPLEGEGVQMILGPNEAGKSTLLHFVRELLFDFAPRTPYAFAADRKNPVEGSATLALRDGSRVELTRRKGNKNTVSATVEGRDSRLNEAGFAALLDGASDTLFRSIFAFGLGELADGEKSLGDQDVKSALYAGGSANAKRVLEALEAEAARLYTDRSRTMTIDRVRAEMADLAKRIKTKSLRGDDFDRRRKELEEAEAEAQAAADALLPAKRDLAHKKRLAEALPHWIELDRLKRERAGLVAPENFPADGLARFETIEADVARLESERDEARATVETTGREAAEVRFDGRLIDRRAAIDGLNRTIESIKEARGQIPINERRRDEAIRAATNRLAALAPGWSLDDLRGHRPTEALLARVDRLARERRERATALDNLAAKRDGHRETLRDKDAELRALGEPIDAAPLGALLAGEADYKSDLEALKTREKDRRKAARALSGLLPRLNPPLDAPSIEAADLPVPPREAVARARRDLQRIDQQIDVSASGVAKDEAAVDDLEKELIQMEARGDDLPSREILETLRTARDAAWDLVRARLAANPPRPAPDLLEAYPAAVRETDRYADDLFDRARAVAKQAQIQTARERIDRDRRALDELKALRESSLEGWQTLWSGCGFSPLDLETMEGWLGLFDELRTLRATIAEHEQEERVLRDRIETFERRLREHVGDPKADGPALLAAVRERERAARSAEQSRLGLRRDCLREREKADEAEAQRAKRLEEEPAWAEAWSAILAELHLPGDWDVDLVARALPDLRAARDELEKADAAELEIAARRGRLADFEPKVRALAEELAPDLIDLTPEHAAAVLQTRATDCGAARERKEGLEKRLADARRRSANLDAALGTAREARAALLAAVGADSADAFRSIAAVAERVGRIDQEIHAKGREFDFIREREPLDEFVALLESADQALLDLRLAEAEANWRRLDDRKTAAHQNVGSRGEALREYRKGSDEAALLQEQLASKRAQLAADVDRYVPLIFARALLKRAIERFERESQPEMLRATSRIFATMTAGRYAGVERPDDDGGPLQVRRADGDILAPDELSTGTREQLYLAVRLAYVLHYCAENEPLPVVMDDVMANFDDDRARHTLRALDEVSKDVQVIMFTCHPHLIEIGREVLPRLQPVGMPAAAAAAESAGRSPEAAR